MNVWKVIDACAKADGTKVKKEILAAQAKNDGVQELKHVLKLALDPFVTFGVKKFEMGEPCEHEQEFEYNWEHAKLLFNNLQSRRFTGNIAQQKIKEVTSSLNAQQQAVFEMILKKDLRCGMGVKTVNAVFPGLIREFEVQLAQPSKAGKIEFPCIVEAKLDGIRCLGFIVNGRATYYSRNGKPFENFDVFTDDLLILANGKNYVFDGEVVGADLEGSFKGVTEQARRKKDVKADKLLYHVFDVLPFDEFIKKKPTAKQSERTELLTGLFKKYLENDTAKFMIRCINGTVCTGEKSLMRFYEKCVASGYEGVIAKNMSAPYMYKRDACWTKMKPVETLDLEVVGVKGGTGKYEGLLGALVVDHEGVNVNVGSGFSDEQRKKYNTKKMIGKVVEVRYDGVTPDGSLRFPRFVRIRNDKE